MTTLILLRHGRSSANAAGVLAGRTPGVELDETGRAQAVRVVDRLAGVPLAAMVSSPALRCEQTVAPLLAERGLDLITEPGLAEVDYGSWTGGAAQGPRQGATLAGRAGAPVGRGLPRRRGARRYAGPGRGGDPPARRADRRSARSARRLGGLQPRRRDQVRARRRARPATSTTSSGSSSTPARSASCTYTETRPFVVRVNDLGGDVAELVPPEPKPAGGGRAGDVRGRRRRLDRDLTSGCAQGCRVRRRRSTLGEVMSRVIHVFRQPDRFVAGTVGEPGDRSFYLQADRRRPHGQRAAGEAAGVGAGRAHQRPAAGGRAPVRLGRAHRCGANADADPAGRAAGGGVPGRHHGAGLGRRLALDRRRAARGHRGGGRRVGRPRRHRRGPGRAARVPVPAAGPRVRRARGEGGIGRAAAVPAVRRAAGPGGPRLRPAERLPPARPRDRPE